MLHIVTVIAVLTNCALMAVASEQGVWVKDKLGSEVGLVIVVVGAEHIMLLIKYWLQTAVSVLPQSVIDAKKAVKFRNARKRNSDMRAKKERRSAGSGRFSDIGGKNNNNGGWRNSSVGGLSILNEEVSERSGGGG